MNHHKDVSGSFGSGFFSGWSPRDSLVGIEWVVLVLGLVGGVLFGTSLIPTVKLEGEALETAIGVTAGLFAVQLTVVTFVLVFAVDTSVDWPSLKSVVRHSGLAQWLLAGFLGFGSFTFLSTPDDREALTFFCIFVVIAGFIPIKLLFDVTSDRGREGLLVSDLETGQSLRRKEPGMGSDRPDSGDLLRSYTAVFQSSLNESQILRLESLVRQLTLSSSHSSQTQSNGLLTRAQLHLWCMQRVVRAILFGEIRSASSTELLRALTVSLCSCTIAERRTMGSLDSASEIQAACFLGVTGRFLAWTARVAARMADMASPRGSSPDPRAFYLHRSLFEAAVRSQGIIGEQVDPDPPDIFLPANEWERSHGLVDPEAGLIWWALSVDQNGSSPGVYQLAEILTGEKFFGSFGWGYRSVLGEVKSRLEETQVQGGASPFPVRAESAAVLGSFGGLGEVSAEVFGLAISTWETFGTVGIDAGLGWAYTNDPARFARRVRVFCLGPPEFSTDGGGLRLALERIARFTGPLDRYPSFSNHAFAVAARTFRQVNPSIPGLGPSLVFPRFTPLQERPGAAVLSVVIRCVDFSDAARVDAEFTRSLLSALPPPLLVKTYETARDIFPGESTGAGLGTSEMVDSIVDRLRLLETDLQETGDSIAG